MAVGTEGDVRPFVALGGGLRRAGHAVRIATTIEFAALVSGEGLEFAELSGDPRELMAREIPKLIAGGHNLVWLIRTNQRIATSLVGP